jgi:alkanesulfonate monooxygenase SsuD/methylene tetrahydromethanopterin reductase-like flavin-dependent oxidoreductase (luciferase family)
VRAGREHVAILRRLLSGEPVTYEGEVFSVRNVQLVMQPPERPVRIYVAAIGPQMARLAGEVADGVIGYCRSVPYLGDVVLPALQEGAECGSFARGLRRRVRLPVAGHDRRERARARRGPGPMLATAGGSSPEGERSFVAAGYGEEVREIVARVEAADVDGALALVGAQPSHGARAPGGRATRPARVGPRRPLAGST